MTESLTLKWFPKALGAGDTAGEGARRLLGQPDLGIHSLLVREAAQNSWDARLLGAVPEFQIRIRTLGEDVRRVMRDAVFLESAPNLRLRERLQRNDLQAIEIVDRGTKGLGGPTRNDLTVHPERATDFADFVLTIGAPPDKPDGGGTYGFGKTASYSASDCCTILIWTRVKEPDGSLGDRFIASAIGPSFAIDNRRFTGRQWWGLSRPGDEGEFEPVVGEQARALGEQLFERPFEAGETGTSLLILDPAPSSEEGTLAEVVRDAMLRNLWPKLVGDPAGDRRMMMGVTDEGQDMPLLPAHGSALHSGQAACLEAVRAAQDGAGPADPGVTLIEIRSDRPRKTLGHLALKRLVQQDDDPARAAANTVTLMRSKAELVVSTLPFGSLPIPGFQWVGIFKPLPSLDRAFASAEPPAHDTWNPRSVTDKTDRRDVNMALTRVKQAIQCYLTPTAASATASGGVSTGALSAALAGLAGSRETPEARGARKSTGGGRRSAGPKVEIVSILPQGGHHVGLSEVTLRLDGAKSARVLPGTLAVAVDGPPVQDDDVRVVKWNVPGYGETSAEAVLVPEGQDFLAYVEYPSGLAIDVNFLAEEAP